MATASRRTDTSLERDLIEQPYRFDFFQAVRLWQRIARGRQPVGGSANPSNEVLRFRALLSLAFPPSAIHEIRQPQRDNRPYEMTVAFMGLTGPQGVLPRHYTELLMERVWAKDCTLRDFLDLFNHRMVSLFYRVWEKHHCVVGYEQALTGRTRDRFAQYLWALMGLGTKGLKERLQGIEDVILRYTGVLAQNPKSALALQQILSDYFRVPVQITQFLGLWLSLQQEDMTTLGMTGRNNRLGQTAVAGTSVWDQQAKFKIRVGPLGFQEFSGLLPTGQSYPVLVNLTKFFSGPELDFSVNLVCKAQEVPLCRLRESEIYAPRLGWTTWLKTKEPLRDADQVTFSGTARYGTMKMASA